MSNSYETRGSDFSDRDASGGAEKVETAKQEASDLKATATSQAKDVLGTAKDEAATVVGEAKTQAKDLFAQTQRELREQAQSQQRRLAAGLQSVGDELGTMARESGGAGVAGDLVQQASTRLSAAGAWLGERDPGAVLTEVKRFARRKPGTFILAAAVTGVVMGRLTRALASRAHDEGSGSVGSGGGSVAPAPAPELTPTDPGTPIPAADVGHVDDSPVYAQAASGLPGTLREEGDDDRPHTV